MEIDGQGIARAFAPFVAINEYENAPLFLRRNLSYSAAHHERLHRDHHATALVRLSLEPMDAMPIPSMYRPALPLVAALCALTESPDGQEAMIPLAAKATCIMLPENRNSLSRTEPYVIDFKAILPGGVLPNDVVIVILHKHKDVQFSGLLPHIFTSDSTHRGMQWAEHGRDMTCTLDFTTSAFTNSDKKLEEKQQEEEAATDDANRNHSSGSFFRWFQEKSHVLYALIRPEESMQSDDGICGAAQQGRIEMQPGILNVHKPFMRKYNIVDDGNSSEGADENGEAEEVPGCFSIGVAPIGDATPMLRYTLSLDELKLPSANSKRKQRNTYNNSNSIEGVWNGSPRGNSQGGFKNYGSGSRRNSLIVNKYSPGSPLLVHFCADDGSVRLYSKVLQKYQCPFESCGLRCQSSLTALMQHLDASHPYYEYCVVKSLKALQGEQQHQQQGLFELYVRCRKEWFLPDGTFLPTLTILPNSLQSHPFKLFLFKPAVHLSFIYECKPEERRNRYLAHARYPIDEQEALIEKKAVELSSDQQWIWKDVDLTPTEQELEHARKASRDGNTAGIIELLKEDVFKEEEEEEQKRHRSGTAGGLDKRQRGRPFGSSGPLRPRTTAARQPGGPNKLLLQNSLGLPKFYHSRSCTAFTAKELEEPYDSEDEGDDDREKCMLYAKTALEESKNLCKEEREFMMSWNLYLHNNPIHADFQVPELCVAFAKAHKEQIQNEPGGWFRRCFASHLVNLWKFRLLTPGQMEIALTAAGSTGS